MNKTKTTAFIAVVGAIALASAYYSADATAHTDLYTPCIDSAYQGYETTMDNYYSAAEEHVLTLETHFYVVGDTQAEFHYDVAACQSVFIKSTEQNDMYMSCLDNMYMKYESTMDNYYTAAEEHGLTLETHFYVVGDILAEFQLDLASCQLYT